MMPSTWPRRCGLQLPTAESLPTARLTATNCAFTPGAPSGTLNCPTNGPFGPNVVTPLGRGNVSAFDAGQNITVAPYTTYKAPYVQQFNLDIQREFPGGIFVDAAFAGSRGVHLPNPTATQIDQIPDADLALGSALLVNVPNPFKGINTVSSLNPATNKTVLAGQLLRPYPQYGGVSLAGDGCCASDYSSFQLSVTKRFTGRRIVPGCLHQRKTPHQCGYSDHLAGERRWRSARLEQPQGRVVALFPGRVPAPGDQLHL